MPSLTHLHSLTPCHTHRHRKPKIADHDRRLVARLNSLSQGWGGDIHGFSLRECCTEPASVFGEKASHLYLEFYLSDAHLANMPNRPPNVQPGVVTVSKKDMYKDPRPFAVAFRQLREEYHVPPEFQYELAAFLTLSRSFYDLELRRSCIRIRLMAASTLGGLFMQTG